MNAAKAKFAKNQIVQKFGLAQSRIGWRRGDCMNRLVCRRRIGVIHLHRDDRCCPLSDIYSLSLSSKTHKGEACQSHSIDYFRSANSQPREPMWCGNVSLPRDQCQCHRSVSVAHLAALLVTTSVVWTRPGSACIYIYNKEGSISDDEEEASFNTSLFSLEYKILFKHSSFNVDQ